MPVGTNITITASEPGEDEFAFKILSGPISDWGRSANTIAVHGNAGGKGVIEGADAKGNTATITVEFFDVPQ